MVYLINFLMLILILVLSIGIGRGFDLRRPFSWLYVLCAFLIGPLLGLTTNDLKQGIMDGILLSALTIWGGPIMFRRRQQYKNKE